MRLQFKSRDAREEEEEEDEQVIDEAPESGAFPSTTHNSGIDCQLSDSASAGFSFFFLAPSDTTFIAKSKNSLSF